MLIGDNHDVPLYVIAQQGRACYVHSSDVHSSSLKLHQHESCSYHEQVFTALHRVCLGFLAYGLKLLYTQVIAVGGKHGGQSVCKPATEQC